MFARAIERSDSGLCFRVHPWARRSGAEKAHGARGWSRAASGAARGRPRALLLALERGVLSSALKSAAHGHDQVHVPCIPMFKQESVGYCLLVKVVW